ncbi:hypothetical protein BJ508DRAFT_335151 [Ascobolus immersus RN42]|uniref:Uncharacterized protein n=1 Tax=Ascobolus immersus RN42 TaxID=1160509 RepID=A0A3N4HRN0_ASCIM|nr:hypothetical protein BJ508DRAFT_335151 [Ascobolus immersus RN42]
MANPPASFPAWVVDSWSLCNPPSSQQQLRPTHTTTTTLPDNQNQYSSLSSLVLHKPSSLFFIPPALVQTPSRAFAMAEVQAKVAPPVRTRLPVEYVEAAVEFKDGIVNKLPDSRGSKADPNFPCVFREDGRHDFTGAPIFELFNDAADDVTDDDVPEELPTDIVHPNAVLDDEPPQVRCPKCLLKDPFVQQCQNKLRPGDTACYFMVCRGKKGEPGECDYIYHEYRFFSGFYRDLEETMYETDVDSVKDWKAKQDSARAEIEAKLGINPSRRSNSPENKLRLAPIQIT